MSIDLGNHIDLSMTGISLRSFQITVVQFKLVCRAGMSERVKHHIRQFRFCFRCLLFSQHFICRSKWITVFFCCGFIYVQGFVGDALDENGCPRSIRLELDAALEELYINIAKYAYPEGNGWAEIRVSAENGEAGSAVAAAGSKQWRP